VVKDTRSASRLWLACRMAEALAGALPGRAIHVVADAAYAGKEIRQLPPGITWTTGLRKDALHELPTGRTGMRGRPRVRGNRLPTLARLAATAAFAPVNVARYGTTVAVQAAALTCLWYSVFGSRHVQVILVRDRRAVGYDLALVTTDPAAGPAAVIARYASRWSIEVTKQVFGAGQSRSRLAGVVRRTVPFQLACRALAVTWYAIAGHDPADVSEHRNRAPWYREKTQPCRVLIAARFNATHPAQPIAEEICIIRLSGACQDCGAFSCLASTRSASRPPPSRFLSRAFRPA